MRHLVGDQHQREPDRALEQPGGGTDAELLGDQTVVVDEGVQHLRGRRPHRAALEDELLKTDRERVAQAKDQ